MAKRILEAQWQSKPESSDSVARRRGIVQESCKSANPI